MTTGKPIEDATKASEEFAAAMEALGVAAQRASRDLGAALLEPLREGVELLSDLVDEMKAQDEE